jgi:hypothetical protein
MERSRHEQPGFPRRVGATRRVYTDNLFRDDPCVSMKIKFVVVTISRSTAPTSETAAE